MSTKTKAFIQAYKNADEATRKILKAEYVESNNTKEETKMTTVQEAIEYLQNNFNGDEKIVHMIFTKHEVENSPLFNEPLTDEEWELVLNDDDGMDGLMSQTFQTLCETAVEVLEEQEI